MDLDIEKRLSVAIERANSGQWSCQGNYEVLIDEIEKADSDDRQYRAVRLENGLMLLLIHDPSAEKAAAALDVAVGHLQDPDDMPGLAHFCEHLLFMGTELFPRENDYHEFISSHGGATNAWTAPSDTNFHFRVSAQHLEPALARFSAFFHCPLFEPTCTNRELNAVDSENKKNLRDDGWRLFQLGKGLSAAGHPWRKFGSGCRESLLEHPRKLVMRTVSQNSHYLVNNDSTATSEDGPDGGPTGRVLRNRLIEWWQSEYSAPRMKVAILGPQSLHDLTHMSVKYFSPILDRRLPPVSIIQPPPLGPEEMGTVLFAKSVRDIHTIDVSCCIPPQDLDYESRPANFIAHLAGHEGGGSLHSFLKRKGWITELSTGAQSLGRGFDIFRTIIQVTPIGLDHWREIVVSYFNYILMLKSSSLPLYLFQELETLSQIRFSHKDKTPADVLTKTISSNLQRPFPVRRILSASSLLWKWEEQKVRKILDLVDIRKSRVIVIAKELDKFVAESSWSKEKWYGTTYRVESLDSALVSRCLEQNYTSEFFIPRPNEFIPSDLHVDRLDVHLSQINLFPEVIRDDPKMTVWFKKDDQHWVPKGTVAITIKSPVVGNSASAALMSQLLVNLVVDSLTEYSYEAELAGLRYSLSSNSDGLQLSVAGYDDKIPVLLRTLLEKLKNFKIDASRFTVIHHHLELKLRNLQLESPYLITDHWLRYLLKTGEWTRDELLDASTGVTVAALEGHFSEIMDRTYLEVLIHGNFPRERAFDIVKDVDAVMASSELPIRERPMEKGLIIPKAMNLTYCVETKSDNEVNSALSYYCQVGSVSQDKLRATFSLFGHMTQHSVFNQLRTKEQLGYVVSAAVWHAATFMGWRIRIQSERDPEYLESRVDIFLLNLKTWLVTMSEEVFNRYKSSLIALKVERSRNLTDETTKFWSAIQSGYCDFMRDLVDAQILRGITLQDILDLYMMYIYPQSEFRSKISIWCHAKGPSVLKVSSEGIRKFWAETGELKKLFEKTTIDQLSSGQISLSAATSKLRSFLKENSDLPPSTIDQLVLKLNRCVRRHVEGKEYSLAPAGGVIRPVSTIGNAIDFKMGLLKSNTPYRVIMPLKPPPPSRI